MEACKKQIAWLHVDSSYLEAKNTKKESRKRKKGPFCSWHDPNGYAHLCFKRLNCGYGCLALFYFQNNLHHLNGLNRNYAA